MRVKIGKAWIDSSERPVLIKFEDNEKELISNMAEDADMFCSYPDNIDPSIIERWMDEDNEDE